MGRYPSIQLNYADESTIQRDLAKLKQEVHKSNPSKSVVVPLMKQTFSHTREFILSGLDCLSTILQLHPELKLLYGVSFCCTSCMSSQSLSCVLVPISLVQLHMLSIINNMYNILCSYVA